MKYPWIMIFGPTAVGKSATLEALYQQGFVFSVVNADAFQVYKGLDIGTAKPDLATRQKIEHFGLDIRNPNEQFGIGDFISLSEGYKEAIEMTNKLPVLSGGTAFYFRGILEGLPTAPASDQAVRDQVEADFRQFGLAKLYDELRQLDPNRAGEVHQNDAYRIKRAVEICRITGGPASRFDKTGKGKKPEVTSIQIGLTRPKSELDDRIALRVEEMFEQGLEAEIDRLKSLGYELKDPGMRAIGYREFFEYTNPIEIKNRIIIHSRQYAKRQMTFFRSFGGCEWFDPSDISKIVNYLRNCLTKY